MKQSFSLVMILAIGPAVFAADPPKEKPKPVFHQIDASGDNAMTLLEYEKYQCKLFKELDANNDGKLAFDEFLEKAFNETDSNSDGVVTLDEYLALLIGAKTKGPKDGKKSSPKATAEKKTSFEKMDLDYDGIITFDEYVAYRKARFKAIDANGNGKLTREEFDRYRKVNFKYADTNGNGSISENEWMAFLMPPKPAKKQ